MVDYTTYTDQELVALLKHGDRLALAQIFEKYNDLLYAHAYNKLRLKEDARDIVQDVFVKLWNRHERLEVTSNLPGYLFMMTRNAIFSHLAHKVVVSDYAESYQRFKEEGEAVTDHLIREKQLAAIIEKEIAALPPRMREVFELSRKENLSNKQIAERLGISEATVADQIKKALRQLRIKIGLVLVLAYWFMP
ncbi:RNA polymerase sigma-70 factor [Pedobacter sp. PWIIR3]